MVSQEDKKVEQTDFPEQEREYSVDLPIGKTYSLLLNFFSKMPGVQVNQQKEPSQIVVQIGSWTTFAPGNERGSINIEIKEIGKQSKVTVSFSFLLPYIAYTIYWLVAWLVLISLTSLIFSGIWRLALMYSNFLAFLTIIFVGFSVGYSVRKTKERYIFQLDLFFLKYGYQTSQKKHREIKSR
jgi:hypothetical protein